MPNMNAQSLAVRKLWPMFKSRSNVMVPRQNLCYHWKGLVIRNISAKYEALSLRIKKLWPMIKFVRSWSWSRSHVQNLWYRRKGLVIRNTHAKYESPIC